MNRVFALYLLLCVLGPFSLAQEPIEPLDHGSCWIQALSQSNPASYKVASFGANQTFTLSLNETLDQWVEHQVKTEFPEFIMTRYETALHCDSAGYSIQIQVESGPKTLCLSATFDPKLGLNLINLYPEDAYQPGVACFGIAKQQLGVTIREEVQDPVNALRTLLQSSAELSKIVQSIEPTGFNFALLHLTPEFAFRERDAKLLLESQVDFMHYVRLVWLNRIGSISGEERVLYQKPAPVQK